MIAIMKVLLRSVIRLLFVSGKRSFSWNAMCIQVRAIIDCFIGGARIPLVIVSIHSLFRSVRGLSVGCVKGSYVKPTRATIDCFIGGARIPLVIVSIHSLFRSVRGLSVGCVKGSYVKLTRAIIDCFIGDARIPLIIVSVHSLSGTVKGVSVGSYVKPTRRTPSRYIVASFVWSIVLSHIRFDVTPLKRGVIR